MHIYFYGPDYACFISKSYDMNWKIIAFKSGADSGGGAHPPLKLVKIWFFCRKIVIFHMKYPKQFAPPLKLEKYDFLA